MNAGKKNKFNRSSSLPPNLWKELDQWRCTCRLVNRGGGRMEWNWDRRWYTTTQEKYHLCIPFLGTARPQFQFHVSVSDLCILRISQHISCTQNRRIDLGNMYKSLTDTWVWKLGLWPRNSFSGNICFQFSVLVLCSAAWLSQTWFISWALPFPNNRNTLQAPLCWISNADTVLCYSYLWF
jgi:hypothetical protein